LEKETGQYFFQKDTSRSIDTRQLYVTKRQIENMVDEIFGCGNSVKINRFSQKLYETYPSLRVEEKMKTYLFLNFGLYDYYKCRRTADRAMENLKPEDTVAGITKKKLNQEQERGGINHRLAKGFTIGSANKDENRMRQMDELDENEEPLDPNDSNDIRNMFAETKKARTKQQQIKVLDATKKRKKELEEEKALIPKKPNFGGPVDKIFKQSAKENKTVEGGEEKPLMPKRTPEEKALDKKYRQVVRESMEKVIMKLVEQFIEVDDAESRFECR
jgi:hypothetical protein